MAKLQIESASASASESVIETLHASYLFAQGWAGGSSFFNKYFVIVFDIQSTRLFLSCVSSNSVLCSLLLIVVRD